MLKISLLVSPHIVLSFTTGSGNDGGLEGVDDIVQKSDGQRRSVSVIIVVNTNKFKRVINGVEGPSIMLLMELLLGIQTSLRKVTPSPLKIFQPWRIHCQMGDLAVLGI